ncbi:MAG: DUF4468 domain-containing protein [Candidatus Theseobacter exili]|nr:DUF4468 domain-containing protein [Candidatus Theseobacter exili]
MKKLILLIFALISFSTYGQNIPKLILTKQGIEPIIVQVDSINSATLYKRAMNWVQASYKNPKEVLKANIENEKIRLDGYQEKSFYRIFDIRKVEYDVSYTLEIDFKDGKYKFSFTPNQIWIDGGKVMFTLANFFDDKDINGNSYEGCKPSFEKSINDLSLNFYSYLIGKKSANDW